MCRPGSIEEGQRVHDLVGHPILPQLVKQGQVGARLDPPASEGTLGLVDDARRAMEAGLRRRRASDSLTDKPSPVQTCCHPLTSGCNPLRPTVARWIGGPNNLVAEGRKQGREGLVRALIANHLGRSFTLSIRSPRRAGVGPVDPCELAREGAVGSKHGRPGSRHSGGVGRESHIGR
jgi:hypothetical protein